MSSIFEALADPTRRRILALLLAHEQPVGDLVDALGVAQPSVSKHLARLKAAGLVDLRAEAQRRVYRLTPQPLQELGGWLGPYLGAPATVEAAKIVGAVELIHRENGPQGWTLGFETYLAASAEAAWGGLTDPERLEAWLGKVSIEPALGGRFRVQFIGAPTILGGRILTWSPGAELECRWRINPREAGPFTKALFEIAKDGGGVRLTVTHRGLPPEKVADMAALWHAHLDRLAMAVRGEIGAWTPERLADLQASYGKQFALLQAT